MVNISNITKTDLIINYQLHAKLENKNYLSLRYDCTLAGPTYSEIEHELYFHYIFIINQSSLKKKLYYKLNNPLNSGRGLVLLINLATLYINYITGSSVMMQLLVMNNRIYFFVLFLFYIFK
jgi:hypothetical protein